MALQDLIISSNDFDEQRIEKILRDKAHLTSDDEGVYIIPEAQKLSNEIKILIYFTGKKAWSIIGEKEILTPIIELSNKLGIKGNTLRPILKKLRDNNLVNSKKGLYYLLPMGLLELENMFDKKTDTSTINTRKNKKAKSKNFTSKISIKTYIDQLITENFFSESQSLNNIQDELKKRTIIIPITSLPSYINPLVKKGILEREKKVQNNRKTWVYKQTNYEKS